MSAANGKDKRIPAISSAENRRVFVVTLERYNMDASLLHIVFGIDHRFFMI
jgi:hypothetical protein